MGHRRLQSGPVDHHQNRDHGHGPRDHRNREHGHGPREHRRSHGDERRVIWALLLTAAFMVAEVVGGLLSGSLALLADAAHMLTDTGALALAWFAIRLSSRPPDPRRSFGYHRFQVLAAFVNGATLIV